MKALVLIFCLFALNALAATVEVLPGIAAPTHFEAMVLSNQVRFTWKATPGLEEFEVLAQTEGVLTIHHIYDHHAKEVKAGEYQWKTKFPGKLTIYSVRSVVADITSLPSQEIRCVL